MRRPFEPEDILKIYQERGLRVCTMFNDEVRDGRVAARLGRCCPLTACFVGAPCTGFVTDMAYDRWPGFEVWSFIRGFDRTANAPTRTYADTPEYSFPEYQLGVDTARLLRKHGLL